MLEEQDTPLAPSLPAADHNSRIAGACLSDATVSVIYVFARIPPSSPLLHAKEAAIRYANAHVGPPNSTAVKQSICI